MRDLRVTHTEFVLSLLSTLLPRDVDLEHLKVLAMVGKKPTATVVDRWAHIPGLNLINAYGPVECCPHVSLLDMSSERTSPGNIGRSLGSGLWVANPENVEEPRSAGEEGELLIEGPFVGRGYLNEPKKTREAFISTPTWLQEIRANASPRVYRTGDLSRYTENGTIAYLGRNDLQVKVRVQRIEIGEVEYQLRRILPDTADLAIILATSNKTTKQPRLIAFIALDTTATQSQDSISCDGVSRNQKSVKLLKIWSTASRLIWPRPYHLIWFLFASLRWNTYLDLLQRR